MLFISDTLFKVLILLSLTLLNTTNTKIQIIDTNVRKIIFITKNPPILFI